MAEHTIFASAARTASPTSVVVNTNRVKGVQVVIDCTVDPAAASVVFHVEGVDSLSGKFYTLLTSAAIAAVGTTVLNVGQGVAAAANVGAGVAIPENVRIRAVHADADSITYSVSAHLIR